MLPTKYSPTSAMTSLRHAPNLRISTILSQTNHNYFNITCTTILMIPFSFTTNIILLFPNIQQSPSTQTVKKTLQSNTSFTSTKVPPLLPHTELHTPMIRPVQFHKHHNSDPFYIFHHTNQYVVRKTCHKIIKSIWTQNHHRG